MFKDDCNNKLQRLTFCGVGAHHQNGIAEAKIKQLTLAARTMLLYAQRLWPEYFKYALAFCLAGFSRPYQQYAY